jgi:hypothetical protein
MQAWERWGPGTDSNCRPLAYRASALQLSYLGLEFAAPAPKCCHGHAPAASSDLTMTVAGLAAPPWEPSGPACSEIAQTNRGLDVIRVDRVRSVLKRRLGKRVNSILASLCQCQAARKQAARRPTLPGRLLLIVSVTSYPLRFATRHSTLKCLLSQSGPTRSYFGYERGRNSLTDKILTLQHDANGLPGRTKKPR